MVNYKSPGGLSYNSKKFGGTGGKIFNDNLNEKDALDFYVRTLKNLYDFSADDCTIYWWFADRKEIINRLAFKEAGWHISQIIIWLKNSMVFSHGQDYHRVYEPCMIGWKEKKKHYRSKILNNLKDVFSLDKESFQEMLDVWYENRDVTQDYIHPTQKPVRLAERALKRNSERGDIVLDLFGGSGSTLIACEQMNRNCYMMELDPKYCDAIRKRYARFIGKEEDWENLTKAL
jgi:DNA modification methylase